MSLTLGKSELSCGNQPAMVVYFCNQPRMGVIQFVQRNTRTGEGKHRIIARLPA